MRSLEVVLHWRSCEWWGQVGAIEFPICEGVGRVNLLKYPWGLVAGNDVIPMERVVPDGVVFGDLSRDIV